MAKHSQRGDAGVAMLVVMVIMMVGFFWYQGAGHHGGRDGHMSAAPPAAETARPPLDLLNETYARGEASRDEYPRKHEDLPRQ